MDNLQKVILTHDSPKLDNYAQKISAVSWKAGKYLAKEMLQHDKTILSVVILISNNELVGFAALKTKDIVPNLAFTPFISTVFVAEKFRGNGYSKQLVSILERQAVILGYKSCYIVTQHHGLYETMNYIKIGSDKDIFERDMNIYMKQIKTED